MQDTAGEAETSSRMMSSNGPPHEVEQKQDDQLEHTYSSYVRIRDVALKTCQRRWTIGKSGERGSGISVLAARHDDDHDGDVDDEFGISTLLMASKFENDQNNLLMCISVIKVSFERVAIIRKIEQFFYSFFNDKLFTKRYCRLLSRLSFLEYLPS